MTNRWWIYQKERFPLLKHGLLIAAFSLSAVGQAWLLRHPQADPDRLAYWLGSSLVAFLSLFLFFLQLRIADEFKDFAEDSRYRPHRPVPRGLVSLRELAVVGIAAAFVQFGLALAIGRVQVLLLLLVWGYLLLMSKEFFVSKWLIARPLLYLLSHAVIMPLLAFYATGCDWVRAGSSPSGKLFGFLLVSYCSSLVLEIGRKIRAPQDEAAGVATYSALWGRSRSVGAWLLAVWLMAVSALWAAAQVQFLSPVAIVLLLLLTGSLLGAWRYLTQLTPVAARQIETLSGLWTLLVYLAIGVLPALLRLL